MPSCSVPRCSNHTMKRKMYMACFSSDPKRKKIWINNIGEIGWKPTKYSHQHFANKIWERIRVDRKRKLKCNAVSTIFSARSKRSSTCFITNDHTNTFLERAY